ncbi:MAG: glycoside hydrolase family 2 TIM barrel-domain containing protein, partial [Bacteroidales bacterium]
MNIKTLLLWCCVSALSAYAQSVSAQNGREKLNFDENWQFSLGYAGDPAKDFGAGTEYFNYLTKANSIHNAGPYVAKFDASSWKTVNLPHDFVVDLPFASNASHSHGYKTVGYKFPETSVGWYRKTFRVDQSELGNHFTLQFDGIFRDAIVWVNGFYMGGERSGYATRTYDITDYLNYGGENLICVRADATFEEGWFYEGAGIYRHVWLHKTHPLHVAPFGTFVSADVKSPYQEAVLKVETTISNASLQKQSYQIKQTLLDAKGVEVATQLSGTYTLASKDKLTSAQELSVSKPHLWDLQTPYLYTVRTEIVCEGSVVDSYRTTTGIREIRFDANEGFFLNGKPVKLVGVNMHQDHAGVGSAIPDALNEYRIERLKSFGCNIYRSSHNPMTPELLDICDRLGMLVIEENRLMGINEEHRILLERMIVRDRNHPSIILWSVGNEEWGI